ncbi:PQQ-binding-like beta-propeller repeat protein [Streptomyces griseus]|uniref:outer membrane protein assembly factor BamB family protein n=1 Tax=Streptomyces griseus TaxID=1911 RepID=UPI000AAE9BE6|nr:PQQ-binding-like beta-propeller repeat protein [Streptomyces griseus]
MSFGPPPSMYTQSTVSADQQRRRKRRRTLLGAVAAVATAALGAGALLVSGVLDQDPKKPAEPLAGAHQGRLDVRETVEKRPASTTGTMGFRFSTDDMSAGEQYELPGMWATDRILAKGINRTVVGLPVGTDASVGDEKWKLRLSGPICGYTNHVTGENRTAVLFKGKPDEHALCDHVAFFDLDDGRKIWQHEIPVSGVGDSEEVPENDALQDDPSVTLTRGTVAVTWGGGSDAYDMDHGRRLWRTKATGNCGDDGAAGGGALFIRVSCWHDGKPTDSWESLTYKVRAVDPRTGRTKWTYSAATGVRDVKVPSTDPAVLAVAAGDTGYTELLSLDGKGKNRATIRLQNGQYVGECTDETDYLLIDDCPTMPVGGGQVFLRSKDSDDALHPSNWIVGFDLATGNTTKKFESGPNETLRPIRTSGGKLLALRQSSDRIAPMGLVSLDPGTGEETPYFYFGLPLEAENFTIIDSNDVLVQNGRLYFGARRVSGPAKQGQKEWTQMVLGIESAARKGGPAQ